MPTILFIGHDASLTGAPISLLRIIKWFKNETKYSIQVLLRSDGPLYDQYKALATTYILSNEKKKHKDNRSFTNKIIYNRFTRKTFNSSKPSKSFYEELFPKNTIDIIFSNTVANGTLLKELVYLNCPVICRVAEMGIALSHLLSNEFNETIKFTNYFISVSNSVKTNLVNDYKINPKQITVIYGAIEESSLVKQSKLKTLKQNEEKNYTKQFIINGSGTVDIRKGYDIFILVAHRALQKYPDIPFKFNWYGRIPDNLKYFIANDIKQSGLNKTVFFEGLVDNPYTAYSNASVFLLTSREDPFPLVAIEHAALGKPVVCFDKGTGTTEFVEDDAGIIVPYLNIEKTADALAELYYNKEMYQGYSNRAAQKASNYSIDVQAPKILELIKRIKI